MSPGTKKKNKSEKKKAVCAVVETFFHFETCECAVMIKPGHSIFQCRTINGSQHFPSPSEAAQKILDLVPDLVVLGELNFTKVVCGRSSYPQISSCTPP